ncbi:hypothetical protein KKF82_06215 [Patescibacteria group bacterium]|nr:hypothetical protein [Patescibacteria group bacterium]
MRILLDKGQECTNETHVRSSFSIKTDDKSIIKKIDVYMLHSKYNELFNKHKDAGLVNVMREHYGRDANGFIKILSDIEDITKVVENDIEKTCKVIEINTENVSCYFELTGMLLEEWKNIQEYKAFDYYSSFYGQQKSPYVYKSSCTNNGNNVIVTPLGFGSCLLYHLKDIGYKTAEKDFNTILEKENEIGTLRMIEKANSRKLCGTQLVGTVGYAGVFLSPGNMNARGNDVVINANKYSYVILKTVHINNWLEELTKILGYEIMFKLTEATFAYKKLDGFGDVAKEMILNIVPPKIDSIEMNYELDYYGRDFKEFYPFLYQSIKGYLMNIRGYHWSQEHITDKNIEPHFNEDKKRSDFYIVKAYGGKIVRDEVRQIIAITEKLIQPFWHSYSKIDNETLSKYVERVGDAIVETDKIMENMKNISDISNFAEKYEQQCQCTSCMKKIIGKYYNDTGNDL